MKNTNPNFQPLTFAGGLYDSDTKLIRFGARDYDPSIGRFTSKDPSLFNGGTANLYEYALSDPMSYFDDDGLAPKNAMSRDTGGGGPSPGGSMGGGGGGASGNLGGIEINGYTRHGLNQAIGRDGGLGVSPRAILDTVRNPLSIRPNPTGGSIIDRINARVILNPQGNVISTIPFNSGAVRCPIQK